MSRHEPGRPVDSDVDLHVPAQRAELRRAPWSTLGVIAAGGVTGTLARYGLGVAFPQPAGAFPWTTLTINTAGSLLIGVLMVAITELWTAPGWVRPLLGVGVLGGFTTFSTFVVDTGRLLAGGQARAAVAYLLVTPVLALAGVWAGSAATRKVGARGEGRGR
ncbi:putative fluoride ion transporter CrcB 1 [Sphaerisporangium siamense]|uniref:Fluoride-specific ion channel FluC n=1 Tax=Sphaerisporangium siamense TaxID=795645 RepID=A0A7W7DBR8_9ACTN|nr:CrcB family protein [Sphaerisporangium siamense]MBB4703918.1 CrcB protein [Sphaerisporangium siamense]GII82389.1 putative fluoride ion transporter CrcB 1 [Sphaerisporangium siamense]